MRCPATTIARSEADPSAGSPVTPEPHAHRPGRRPILAAATTPLSRPPAAAGPASGNWQLWWRREKLSERWVQGPALVSICCCILLQLRYLTI